MTRPTILASAEVMADAPPASFSSMTSSRSRRCSRSRCSATATRWSRPPTAPRRLRASRADLRPRRAGRDAAADGRPRGLPAAARQGRDRADHHAHGQVRGDRQGARPGARRRRLHHQAVLDARVPLAREGGAAPRGDGAADDRRRAPIEVRDLRIDPAKRTVTRNGERSQTTYVEFEILAALARSPRPRLHARHAARARVGRLRLPRPAHDRRPHPPPAREDRGRCRRSPSTCSRCAGSATASATRTASRARACGRCATGWRCSSGSSSSAPSGSSTCRSRRGWRRAARPEARRASPTAAQTRPSRAGCSAASAEAATARAREAAARGRGGRSRRERATVAERSGPSSSSWPRDEAGTLRHGLDAGRRRTSEDVQRRAPRRCATRPPPRAIVDDGRGRLAVAAR